VVIALVLFAAVQQLPKLLHRLGFLPLEQVAIGVHHQRDSLVPHERLDFFGARPGFDVPSAPGAPQRMEVERLAPAAGCSSRRLAWRVECLPRPASH
jgi:hypothetical protein